jgi:hypothetical protein
VRRSACCRPRSRGVDPTARAATRGLTDISREVDGSHYIPSPEYREAEERYEDIIAGARALLAKHKQVLLVADSVLIK